jgi:hypothetical protein
MLIVTLPSVLNQELLERIISHPLVSAVRYNTGIRSPYSAKETLVKVSILANFYGKKIWIDLKGRQLRITHWAAPDYGRILLNHRITVELPAKIYFRGSGWSELKAVKRNEIFVDPFPPHAVGAGQAVNIFSRNLKVKGYSTAEDSAYIKAAGELGISSFMLSFVEKNEDIAEVRSKAMSVLANKELELALKIESRKGVEFVKKTELVFSDKLTLLAATDDLMINFEDDEFKVLNALELIVSKDKSAIFASNIFTSLAQSDNLSLTDVQSLRLSQLMGYHKFMLCDNVSGRHFNKAMEKWKNFWLCCD